MPLLNLYYFDKKTALPLPNQQEKHYFANKTRLKKCSNPPKSRLKKCSNSQKSRLKKCKSLIYSPNIQYVKIFTKKTQCLFYVQKENRNSSP